MGSLPESQLRQMGFRHLGSNVKISECASLHGVARISIGDESRIDDFCVLSAGEGGISIGRHVHIASHCILVGQGAIVLEDFSGLSSRCAIYSSTDDYSGKSMTNPTVPDEFRDVTHAPVRLGRHALVGSGTTILPGVTLGEGAAVWAMSLVRGDCEPFQSYFGVPAKRMTRRSRDLLELEQRLEERRGSGSPSDDPSPR
ncbi:acyltransferase [Candidatus Sumerlaeota bacterium]|nr:acyltransferase [Candidatus Sumerlaeota bacterium]